jgi:hypothetical protein
MEAANWNEIGWPQASVGEVSLTLPSSRQVDVRRISMMLTLWTGELPHTMGGKAILDLDGESLYAELVVLRLLQRSGWEGVWVNGSTMRVDVFGRADPVRLPPGPRSVLDLITRENGAAAGCWDVFAWREDEVAFVECKSPTDRLRPSQLTWLEAALRAGVPEDAFALAEWASMRSPNELNEFEP